MFPRLDRRSAHRAARSNPPADQDLGLGTGLLIAEQAEQLIRAQRGVRPATHMRHQALAASVAGLYSHDAQCLAVLHDLNLITLIQTELGPRVRGYRHLPLAV